MAYVIGLLVLIALLLYRLGYDVTRKFDELLSAHRRTNELLLGFPAVRRQVLHLRLREYGQELKANPEDQKNPFIMAQVDDLRKTLEESKTPEESQQWWWRV